MKLIQKTNFFIALGFILLAAACSTTSEKSASGEEIIGLATPFQLNNDFTSLQLKDYFLAPEKIHNLLSLDGLQVERNNEIVHLNGEIALPLGLLEFHSFNHTYHIPVFKSDKLKYTFEFKPKKNYQSVYFKSEINGWTENKDALFLNEFGNWQIDLVLSPGEYAYKLILDGEELSDYNNPDSISNNSGGFNSVMKVGNYGGERPLISAINKHNTLVIKSSSELEKLIVLFENQFVESSFVDTKTYQIDLNKIPKIKGRSHLRVYACNAYERSNELILPLENGNILTNTNSLNRTDKHSFIMYFLMVDRFFNGNTENDFPLNDPKVLPAANYYGGDLLGVSQQLSADYFTQLGVNTLWLSPIVQNPVTPWGLWPNPKTKFSGYHGYWPVSSSKVDFRFGTEQELKQLIATTHEKNMNILLDYVANHVHIEHPVYKRSPEWATDLYLPDGTMNTEKWDEHRLTTWFDSFLATLDFSKAEVVEEMTDSALFWFENYEIDGFRHDATKHIPLDFWRTLTHKLKSRVVAPEGRSIYQIGETYGSSELINSYVNSGMLDAQFDFNLYDAAVAAFAIEENSFEQLAKVLQNSLNTYGYLNLMGNISGNQDRARFISYADGAVRFDEDAKLAGWTRKINNKDSISFEKLAQLHAFNLSIPGIPVIYYGDEIGMPGGNDPDNRRPMIFENLNPLQQSLKQKVSKLCKLRSQRMELMYGNFELLNADEQILIYKRNYLSQSSIIVFNKTSKNIQIPLENITKPSINFNNLLTKKSNSYELELRPFSFEIIFEN